MFAAKWVFVGAISVVSLLPSSFAAEAQVFGNRGNAQTQMQIDQLQQQVRLLTGQVEQLNYQVQTLQEQLRRFQEDAEFRFQQLESGGRRGGLNLNPGTGGAGAITSGDTTLYPDRSAQGAVGQGPTGLDLSLDGAPLPGVKSSNDQFNGGALPAPPRGGPIDLRNLSNGVVDPMTGQPYVLPQSHEAPEAETDAETFLQEASLQSDPEGDLEFEQSISADPNQLYSAAYGAVMRGDYPTAEEGFATFLDAHPDHPLAIDARYWLGESYLSRGLYEEAADSFLDVYEADPGNTKAPTSLLKLARAMDGLGESAVACATLRDVITKYPDVPSATENAKVELLRGKC